MTQADTLEKLMNQPRMVPSYGYGSSYGPQPRVLCITSGKGGVGKTNVAANLAFSLRKLGKRVLVLDADLNLANIDVLLGLSPRFNLQHVFNGEKTIADILLNGPGGMQILPGSSGILELAELTESQKIYFLSEMEALAREIDILIIDTAAGINNNVVYFNLAARERVVLLTPEPTSLTDAYALVKVLSSRFDVKRFRILVNYAANEKEAVAVFRKLSTVADRFLPSLSLDYLGYIPYDAHLPKAVRSQRLVSELFPRSEASRMFLRIGEQLAQEEDMAMDDGNIKFFWQGLVQMNAG